MDAMYRVWSGNRAHFRDTELKFQGERMGYFALHALKWKTLTIRICFHREEKPAYVRYPVKLEDCVDQ